MTFKQSLHSYCHSLLSKKIKVLENVLKELGSSSASDTKSSAGDKHETARAMVQIEQENVGKQLKELLEQRTQLERIDSQAHADQIRKGSLVKTDKGYLYLSIALGKIVVDGETVVVISPASPLGIKLIGLKEKNVIEINSNSYQILKIV